MSRLQSALVVWSIVACPVVAAQEDASQLVLEPHWQVGDRYGLKITLKVQETYGKEKRRADAVRSSVDVAVTAADEGGYSITWTWGECKVTKKTKGTQKEIYEARAERDVGLVVELRADADGRVRAVTNLPAVREHYVGRMAEIRGGLGDDWDDFRFSILSGYLGWREELADDELEAALLADVAPLYACGGLALALDGPTAAPRELDNPFGGEALPLEAAWEVKRFDERRGQATLAYEHGLDPAHTKATLLEQLTAEAKAKGRPKPKKKDVPALVWDEETEVVWDTAKGLPLEVRIRRETTVDQSGSVVELEIERMKPR